MKGEKARSVSSRPAHPVLFCRPAVSSTSPRGFSGALLFVSCFVNMRMGKTPKGPLFFTKLSLYCWSSDFEATLFAFPSEFLDPCCGLWIRFLRSRLVRAAAMASLPLPVLSISFRYDKVKGTPSLFHPEVSRRTTRRILSSVSLRIGSSRSSS